MVFAVVYAENGDVVATYDSRADAERDLAAFVGRDPGLQHEIGLRPYEGGRPVGAFAPASEVLADRLPQQHLV